VTPFLAELGEDTRLVVSEPLSDLSDAWNEIPEASWGVIQPGPDELHPFQPSNRF
jgi:glutamine amidotransferase